MPFQKTALAGAILACCTAVAAEQILRPPAVPLMVHDPYFSIWSFGDRLPDDWPRHWTGAVHALASMVRVDGEAFRLMGTAPRDCPAARQVALRVLPTRTIYVFEAAGLEVTLTFTTPLLPEDLELVSRPVTYLTWQLRSADGRPHETRLYFDSSAELVVNEPRQQVTWSRPEIAGLDVMRIGTESQPVLAKDGDNLRIDWGYLYVAARSDLGPQTVIAQADDARETFMDTGRLPTADDPRKPRAAGDGWPVCACAFDIGRIADPSGKPGKEGPSASRWLMLAYDDLYSIQYLGEDLRPWWRRDGLDAEGLLKLAAEEYADLRRRCEAFDAELICDLARAGGPKYADLCALAYRQALGAHKLAAASDGEPLFFSKECFSNGCIGTVDVAYPASPVFALLSGELLKATVEPVFRYAATERWKFPFAPHDLGRYPKANGQRYGGGETSEERQMPVEECGNMLILATAICRVDGHTEYAERHWPLLAQWAAYLKSKGLDPENQLSTDDFAGHLAHNANLSLKAIVALGGYAKMCEMSGRRSESRAYRQTAEAFAAEWVKMADDGDHFRLAFDKPGTWSQKYNLVWDGLLGLNLFPPEVARKEIAFYKTKLHEFGLPLDNRQLYTKTDWEVWTATLAETPDDFRALMEPVYAFVDATPHRVPLTDWYWSHTAERRGFQARPVIGGVFIRMLGEPEIWRKWSGTGRRARPTR
jgi:hypothetical protein